jgi:hypothetical protein
VDGAFASSVSRSLCSGTEGGCAMQQMEHGLDAAVRRELERLFTELTARVAGSPVRHAADVEVGEP